MTRAVLRIANRVVKSVGILRPFNFVFRKKVGGRWFRIPVLGGVGIGHVQQYEKWMIELLALLIPLREGTFVDIGANLGQTLLKLKSVSPDARYLGLEPNPVCVNYLRSLIRSNDWDDVQVLPVGISNVNRLAELEFYYDNDTAPGASVISGFRPGRRVHHRQYVTLCTFEDVERTANVGTTAVIKIDVEGAELEVLRSVESALRRDRPFVLLEILPTYGKDEQRRIRQTEVEQMLGELGYSIARVTKGRGATFEGLELLERIGDHSDVDACDYVCFPGELRAGLAAVGAFHGRTPVSVAGGTPS